MAGSRIIDYWKEFWQWCRDFIGRLFTWLVSGSLLDRREYDLDLTRRLFILVTFAATTLAVTGLVLTDPKLQAGFPAAYRVWRWSDTLLLVPSYVLLGGMLCLRVAAALVQDKAPAWLQWCLRAAALAFLCMGVADVVENHVDPAWGGAGKRILGGLGAILLSLASLCWYFELGLGRSESDYVRGELRWAVADIIWRSRYTLTLLVIFGALVLGMDQGRDVLVGLAQAVQQAERFGEWVVAIVCLGMSALAVWAFAYVSWLWTRILLRTRRADSAIASRIAARVVSTGARASTDTDLAPQFVARWWPRILGTAPIAILVWLCGFAALDAARVHAVGIVFYLYAFAATSTLGAWLVLWQRQRKQEDLVTQHYYDADDGPMLAETLREERYGVRGIPLAPVLVPLFALLLFILLRGFALVDPAQYGQTNVPPVTLAAIGFVLAFWGSLLGWLARAALRQQRPWVLSLAVLVGVFGALGLAENHAIWQWGPGFQRCDDAVHRLAWMYAALCVLAVGLALLLWTLFTWRPPVRRNPTGVARLVAAVIIAAFTLAAADHGIARKVLTAPDDAARREGLDAAASYACKPTNAIGSATLARTAAMAGGGTAPGTAPRLRETDGAGTTAVFTATGADATAKRLALDEALAQWLENLCAEHHCETAVGKDQEVIPVYFVTAEGGGIRAAYWTAIVLDELGVDRANHPRFATHAFSLSGVSGGSVGLAAWRSCLQASGGALDCSNQLGTAGLLTPLLSAWLMEDTVARLMPTSLCKAPGCNLLDRGSWFESALEQAVPRMRQGLMRVNAPPYLFLNSTTVETGERSIASPVRIHWEQFATARDQLAWLGGDPGIASAAHNSARFTYVNAIGAIRRSDCDAEDANCPRDAQRYRPVVSRLADGGYFDNSGALTTIEILRAFERCVTEGCPASTAQVDRNDAAPVDMQKAQAVDMPKAQAADAADAQRARRLAWLRARLEPRIVMIRNGLPREEQETTGTASVDAKGLCQVDAKGKRLTPKEAAQPRCSDSLPFYPDLLAPPITAFNVGGTGVAARLAEAQLTKEVRRVRAVLRRAPLPIAASAADAVAPGQALGAAAAAAGAPASAGSAPATECIDLREDDTLYPLGWYLSTMARGGMLAQRMAYFNGTRALGCDEQGPAAQASFRLDTLAEREPGSGGLSAAW